MKSPNDRDFSLDEDVLQTIISKPEARGTIIRDTLDSGIFISNHYIEEGTPYEVKIRN
jgi:hypothetical protein